MKTEYRKIPIAAITGENPSRNDGLDEDHVARIRQYLPYSKRLTAVLVRRSPDPDCTSTYELLDGEHRLAAAKTEGETTIWAEVIDADDDVAVVNTIVSNLVRKNYTPEEEAEHTAQLVELFKQMDDSAKPLCETPRKPGRPAGAVSKAANVLHITPQAVRDRLKKANGSAGRTTKKTTPPAPATTPTLLPAWRKADADERQKLMEHVAQFHGDEYGHLFHKRVAEAAE